MKCQNNHSSFVNLGMTITEVISSYINYLIKQVLSFYIVKMPHINKNTTLAIFDSSFTIQVFYLNDLLPRAKLLSCHMKIQGTAINLLY